MEREMTQHPEEGTLHAYIDGELSRGAAAELEQHVAECAACSAALAEARGLVAAASRVITTLDAAPSSAAKSAAPVAGVPVAPVHRAARRPVFRFPYARAAALLLLAGGTAFVFDRAGTSTRGRSTEAESVTADAAAGSDLAATAPVEAPTPPATAPLQRREPTPVAATRSPGAASPSAIETTRAEFTVRGVAGGTVTKEAALPPTDPSIAERRDAAPEPARQAALSAAPPPPARMTSLAQERALAGGVHLVPTVVQYRTREGIIVTLTEEPLRMIFAEESLATQQSASQPAQQRMAAAAAAPPVNSYRWSSAERGKSYTLSGPLTVAELEALSRRLSELERLP